jgi:ubiquinol-cytochrome c reductase iron-sulfur subunit
MLASLSKTDALVADPKSEKPYTMDLPSYCQNEDRSRDPHKDILVVVGICSHLGCSPGSKFTPGPQPSLPDDWVGGFLCPCHGSTFDLAGRVFKNKPAPNNLDVPPYMYLSDTKIVIGKDEKGEA